MDPNSLTQLERFKNEVGIKFQLFNSLFTSLPFHRIEKTGILLSLLLSNCEEGYDKGMSPVDILNDFFDKHTGRKSEEERIDLLFRFLQYAERQIVLFDALEDAAFRDLHDFAGTGSLKQLQAGVEQENQQAVLQELMQHFAIRLVLTAHPTQFYPGEVLGIIHDLAKALSEDNNAQVNMYLQQLGKTPFLKKEKPTPYDEAISLVWFLENIFYAAAGRILFFMKRHLQYVPNPKNPIIRLGFWPGGDRDGNPFVKVDTTLKVAKELRTSILKCYYLDIRKLKRRLTFKGVTKPLAELEKLLYDHVFVPGYESELVLQDILGPLLHIRQTLKKEHNGLFIHLVETLINKVEVFGLHFASLDVRQDSSVHTALWQELAKVPGILPDGYAQLDAVGKMDAIMQLQQQLSPNVLSNEIHQDTLKIPATICEIQRLNGEAGCHRYIISQCQSALNVLEVFGLFLLNGWQPEKMPVDIVPLFETIDDLQGAAAIMETLYMQPGYREHLRRRGHQQTIMLGFSDGTKDGGYLMANWCIYKAKEELTMLSRKYDIEVVFFDGRGGPPSRGGGKTHKFYASMGQNISNREIQLTIQGQTVSSNFGTVDAAQFNMEQLMNAGLSSTLFASKLSTLEKAEEQILVELANLGYKSYQGLKNHPNFLDYLSSASPLRFYADTNIGSRPAKRGGSAKLALKDLRAIPFVGAWSQIKQNVTGYYGVGTALHHFETAGRWQEVADLYQQSLFFRTLIDNSEMAMKKCFFPLTAYLGEHAVYGKVWHMIHDEYNLTRKMVLKLSGNTELMGNYPVEQLSIQMRERIVIPLTTIQQFGLAQLRRMEEQVMTSPLKNKYEKLVMRCSFGIINAGRNSA
ncbi:MAG: phosphoenolpyruvate carboxylase [Bacteroidetes bacterium]|uniref:phosphoenolpyruvate carboxylase n=1 Tax=Phnomibacter sp. TaxID=2836217 RepID=UPI002FDCA76F|nr:phosphoenolpyruvate carboxylase [Bacteroidota bacterium]